VQYNVDTFAVAFEDRKQLYLEVEEFLTQIFYNLLHANLKDKSVVVVESIFSSRILIETIGECIFKSFGSKAVYFLLGNVLPLYTSGLDTGLVVDCGF